VIATIKQKRDANGLPTNWEQARVGDILTIRNGYAVKSSDYRTEGVPLIRQSDINGDTIDISAAKRVPTRVMEECGQYLVRKDDLLIGMSGSLGKIGRYVDEEVAIQNQRTGLLQVKPGFTPGFAKLVLKLVEQQIIAEGKGVAVQNVSAKEIEDCTFPLPPEGERERIVAEIEKQSTRLDAAVASLKRVQSELKRYRASVLKAACAGRLVPTEAELARKENRSYETGEALLQRILKERREKWKGKGKYNQPLAPDTTNLASLPEGWAWGTWNQLSNWVTYGFTRPMPHVDTGIPIITAKGIKNGKIDFAEADLTPREAYNALSEKDRPKRNDILVTKDGTIGRAAVVETERDFCINQSVAVIWLRSCAMDRRFLLAVIDSEIAQKPIWAKARGVAIQHLSITDFAKLPVPIPPLAEQERIAVEVERRISVVSELESAAARNHLRANRLRQSVLQNAFSGKTQPDV